jgi:hypothetical protein
MNKRLYHLINVLAGLTFVAMLSGCVGVALTPKEQFSLRNPEEARDAVELFEIPLDQWVELEMSDGLGALSSRAVALRKSFAQAGGLAPETDAEKTFSNLIEQVDYRLINVLVRIDETRRKMGSQDKLLFCRKKNDLAGFYGRFYIVRDGYIREEVSLLPCTWGIGNEALWSQLLKSKNEK